MGFRKLFVNIGPGPLVASAFIGPGTVTLCTLAGVQFGYSLLWALLIALAATLVLQEMSVRLGVITGKNLAEVIRLHIDNRLLNLFAIVLVLSAIVIGNAAYEAGNISGSRLGLQALLGETQVEVFGQTFNYLSVLIGAVAFVLLFIGNHQVLEQTLILLVALMSVCFVITAIVTGPNLSELMNGLLIPSFPDGSALVIVGLIGTTVVPYNLFLHSSLVKEKWSVNGDLANNLSYAKKDMVAAIVLGGVISISIVICAAAIQQSSVTNAADLAKALEPLLGTFAKYFLAIGLFAAGISSAILAPLAAAYVVAGCFGWPSNLKSWPFRCVWGGILILGVVFSSLGVNSIEVIKFAQITNGIVLPVVAAFLLWVMNHKTMLGDYVNTLKGNILGGVILLITIILGANGIIKAMA